MGVVLNHSCGEKVSKRKQAPARTMFRVWMRRMSVVAAAAVLAQMASAAEAAVGVSGSCRSDFIQPVPRTACEQHFFTKLQLRIQRNSDLYSGLEHQVVVLATKKVPVQSHNFFLDQKPGKVVGCHWTCWQSAKSLPETPASMVGRSRNTNHFNAEI